MISYKTVLLSIAILITVLMYSFNQIKIDQFNSSQCNSNFFPNQDPRDDIAVDGEVTYDDDYSNQIGNAAMLSDSYCFGSKDFGYNEALDKLDLSYLSKAS